MNVQQRNWLDGHTVAELCVLLTDLWHGTNNLHTSVRVREAGVTPAMVAQMLVHRTVLGA